MLQRVWVSWFVFFGLLAGLVAQVGAPPDPGQLDGERLQRLSEIARQLQDPAQDGVALATEAARLCGFVIWNEQRQVLAEPTGAPRLYLAVTAVELRDVVAMLRAGHAVARDDLLAGLDVLYRSLGLEGSLVPTSQAWLRNGTDNANPSARALASFLNDLAVQRSGRIDGAEDFDLDPLQALLVLRVLTEEVLAPVRGALARGELGERPKGPSPFAEAAEEAPGWAEDAFVGGIAGLAGEVIGGIGKLGKGLKDAAGKANAIASVAKFVLTYTFLKGRVWDDDPDNPLIRTKTRDPGQQCTMFAAFWIDGTRVTDWLKEHRTMASLAGLDLDMPKSGPLKGIETNWDIKQDRHSSKYHLIQTVRGQSDISKIKTDDQGEASIRIEGCAQAEEFDPLQVLPVEKRVRFVVTPQVKATEMQQDLVDAVLGAIGIKDGGAGFLTPVIECLYRMKWKGSVVYDLEVRDWLPAEAVCSAQIEVKASGSVFGRTSSYRMSLDRVLRLTDARVDVIGFEVPPPLDPALLKMVPKTMREQMQAGYRQMAELAKKRTFMLKAPGRYEYHLRDTEAWHAAESECGGMSKGSGTTTWSVDQAMELDQEQLILGELAFGIECDLEQKTATLQVIQNVEADFVQEITADGKQQRKQGKVDRAVFAELRLLPPFDQKIVMPLKETPGADPGVVSYYGVVAVPFTFGRGFRGSALIDWSVKLRRPPK